MLQASLANKQAMLQVSRADTQATLQVSIAFLIEIIVDFISRYLCPLEWSQFQGL